MLTTEERESYFSRFLQSKLPEYHLTKSSIPIDFTVRPGQTSSDAVAYSDGEFYHYVVQERGHISIHNMTKDLDELLYWIIRDSLICLASLESSKWLYVNGVLSLDPERIGKSNEEMARLLEKLFAQLGPSFLKRYSSSHDHYS